ncbi:MAG: hypothetical protein IT334_12650 [Thermomicrobiales bacterium]|nr:hypothetical protein [Thermomicrobiales bacterium]
MQICYRIAGGIGNPASGACASASGAIRFHNVPQGSYTLALAPISVQCADAPASVAFSVGPGDLGGTVQVPVEYVGCGYKPTTSCTVERAAPGRTVDLYYGQLTGPDGGPALDTLQLSETIPSVLRESLLGAGNPDPAHITSGALAPWSEPYQYESGTLDWSRRPDWDGNAYKRMLDVYSAASNDYTLNARISHGSYQFTSGAGLDFIFVDGATDLSLYPECADATGDITILLLYQSTVNIYELNAAEPVEPGPGVTPIPSPVPMCDTSVTRSIDLYYGSVSGLPYVAQSMALSDYIPPALRDVMLNSSPPGPVRTNIGAWVGADQDDGTWAESAAAGIDAAANQRSQLANSGATVTAPIDEGVTEYRFVTYRYLDAMKAPGECRSILLAADEEQPSMSVLIPVLQTTVVRVHYYQMNAVYGGIGSPTPTPTIPAGTTPTPAGPDATATGLDVRGLPNTGTGYDAAPTGNLWLIGLAMVLASIVLMALRRGRPRN